MSEERAKLQYVVIGPDFKSDMEKIHGHIIVNEINKVIKKIYDDNGLVPIELRTFHAIEEGYVHISIANSNCGSRPVDPCWFKKIKHETGEDMVRRIQESKRAGGD